MGSPGRHLRPDQREQEELVRPDETKLAIPSYYSLSNFLYIYMDPVCVCLHTCSLLPGGATSRILAWEDGFCNFAASGCDNEGTAAPAAAYTERAAGQEANQQQGLQPELFFKMSHDIYNYGEGYVL